jgi:hypothetical protein
VGVAIGCIGALGGFIWLNRNQAARLDALEQKVRDFKKP